MCADEGIPSRNRGRALVPPDRPAREDRPPTIVNRKPTIESRARGGESAPLPTAADQLQAVCRCDDQPRLKDGRHPQSKRVLASLRCSMRLRSSTMRTACLPSICDAEATSATRRLVGELTYGLTREERAAIPYDVPASVALWLKVRKRVGGGIRICTSSIAGEAARCAQRRGNGTEEGPHDAVAQEASKPTRMKMMTTL